SGAPKGSVALADGRLYYRTENGTLLLIEPSPKRYIERGRFRQPDRSEKPAWAHPVVANGKLYVRDQDVLFCYDVKAAGCRRSARWGPAAQGARRHGTPSGVCRGAAFPGSRSAPWANDDAPRE